MGLDKLSGPFLKAMAHVLAHPLSCLVNHCLNEHCFPTVWKMARATPISKEPGTSDPNKFRPISIMPILPKLLESWLLHCLRPYLWTNPMQFAFKIGSSVEYALATVQAKVADGFNACHPLPAQVALISLDISTFHWAWCPWFPVASVKKLPE